MSHDQSNKMQDAEKVAQTQDEVTNDSTVELEALRSGEGKQSFLDKLPTWISSNLRSRRSWQTFVRCWLATWVSFVLLLPDKSVQKMGFACVISFLVFHSGC